MATAASPRRRAAIGLGANLGDPPQQLRQALRQLSALPETELLACSRFYRTPPMGPPQPDYCNAACILETALEAPELLAGLKAIERAMGRDPSASRWSARCIDLDLLLLGTECRRPAADEEGPQLPHPGLRERDFVLLPLAEVAAAMAVPGGGTVGSLAARFADRRLPLWPTSG